MKMVLSCVSSTHSMLKQEWAKAKEESDRPLGVLGRKEKMPETKDGLVCIIDEKGFIHASIDIWMPTGIAVSKECMLISSPWGIHQVNRDLSNINLNLYSMRWFNSLHSIKHTCSGFLVASTGLDMLLEFDCDGKILWSWWAIDHGLDSTPMRQQRYINKSADLRGSFFGTAKHTTHINSAVELGNGDILASLFHQGMVIYIERPSGQWRILLDGLDHPHSIRLHNEESFTVADTGHGRALLVKMTSNKTISIEKAIAIDTSWLADCFYNKEYNDWWLLDATNARIAIFNEETKKIFYLHLNPDWRLYSIERI
jgi:hypothetical protein